MGAPASHMYYHAGNVGAPVGNQRARGLRRALTQFLSHINGSVTIWRHALLYSDSSQQDKYLN